MLKNIVIPAKAGISITFSPLLSHDIEKCLTDSGFRRNDEGVC
jgi:hypothetical protein